jgi:hypothetical protein
MLQEESLAESGAPIHVPEARDYSQPNQGYCTRGFDEELLREIVCRIEGLELVADCIQVSWWLCEFVWLTNADRRRDMLDGIPYYITLSRTTYA